MAICGMFDGIFMDDLLRIQWDFMMGYDTLLCVISHVAGWKIPSH